MTKICGFAMARKGEAHVTPLIRHCETRSDVAIHATAWIAALRSLLTRVGFAGLSPTGP